MIFRSDGLPVNLPMNLLKRFFVITLVIILVFGCRYIYLMLPVLSGYSAKTACSCIFIGERAEESVITDELGYFPQSLGKIDVNYKDSTVTGSALGFAKRKARLGHGSLEVEASRESPSADFPGRCHFRSGGRFAELSDCERRISRSAPWTPRRSRAALESAVTRASRRRTHPAAGRLGL